MSVRSLIAITLVSLLSPAPAAADGDPALADFARPVVATADERPHSAVQLQVDAKLSLGGAVAAGVVTSAPLIVLPVPPLVVGFHTGRLSLGLGFNFARTSTASNDSTGGTGTGAGRTSTSFTFAPTATIEVLHGARGRVALYLLGAISSARTSTTPRASSTRWAT